MPTPHLESAHGDGGDGSGLQQQVYWWRRRHPVRPRANTQCHSGCVVVYVSMCRWTTLTHNRMCMDVYALCGRHTCPLLHQWRFAAVACCDLLVQPGRKCLYVFSLWSLRNVVMTRANMHYAIWKLYLRMCGGYWSIYRWTTLTPRMCIDDDARWGRHTCPAAPDKVAANKVRLGRVALRTLTSNWMIDD